MGSKWISELTEQGKSDQGFVLRVRPGTQAHWFGNHSGRRHLYDSIAASTASINGAYLTEGYHTQDDNELWAFARLRIEKGEILPLPVPPAKKPKRVKAEKPQQKRIYVILPNAVEVPMGLKGGKPRHIIMNLGRQGAQAFHVTSLMRSLNGINGEPITTILLTVRNTAEFRKVVRELREDAEVDVTIFSDLDPRFYGTRKRIATAACTVPVLRSDVEDILGHLPMFAEGL